MLQLGAGLYLPMAWSAKPDQLLGALSPRRGTDKIWNHTRETMNEFHSSDDEQQISLYGRDLLSVTDLTRDEIESVFELALAFKEGRIRPATQRQIAAGQTLALIFDKASLRTRVSFETAIRNLGGHPIYLAPADIRLGEREPVKDAARTLSRMVDGIAARLSSDEMMAELAQWADVPVINAMTNLEHPCQAMADLLTVREYKQTFSGLRFAYIGDGFNVCQSLMLLCAILGIDFALASPKGYEPNLAIVQKAQELATGSVIELSNDPTVALQDADVVCTDVWVSGGLEAEAAQRRKDFAGFQLNANTMKLAKPDAIVLHCLPAHRDEEITDEVIEGPQSVVFDEAENRLWAQQAILAMILGSPSGEAESKSKRGR